MSSKFQAGVEEVDHQTVIINLVGDLTGFANRPIQEALNQVHKDGYKNVILNFREGYNISSPGISILIKIIVEAHENDQTLLLAVSNQHHQKLLCMMGLNKHVAIVDSLDTAKQTLH